MDVFTTVVGIVIAGVALFIGYRVGLKDGFRGGFQSGRTLERQLAVEQRRYLAARAAREQALFQPITEQKSLPSFSEHASGGEAEEQLVTAIAPGEDAGRRYDPYEGRWR